MISGTIDMYTDGSCLRNPGPGGYAYIIRYLEVTEGFDMPEPKDIEGSQGFRLTTNNRMEIMACIFGIKKIIENIDNGTFTGGTQVNVFSDSEYLCNSINQRWINKWADNNWMTSGFGGKQPSPVKNKDLFEQVLDVQKQLQQHGVTLTFNHIKGHNGDEYNEKADKLAVAASNGTNQIIDEEYEKTSIRR